jgi:hypothetical protein
MRMEKRRDKKIDKLTDLLAKLVGDKREREESDIGENSSEDDEVVSSAALSPKRTLTLRDDLITAHFPVQQRILPLTAAPLTTAPLTTASPTTAPPALPPDLLLSRADIFIHQFFLQWYEDRLYLCAHTGAAANRVFARLWNTHKLLCCFVPPNTTIPPMPVSTADTYPEHEKWRTTVVQLGFAVEHAAMKFCAAEQQKTRAAAPAVPGKKARAKNLKSTIESFYRRANPVRQLLPVPVNFVDYSGAAGAGPMLQED